MVSFKSMAQRHNDRNDLSRNDRSYSSCTYQNSSDSVVRRLLREFAAPFPHERASRRTQESLRWSRVLAIKSCPGCGQKSRVPDSKQGTAICPHCGSKWFQPNLIEQSKTRTTNGYLKWLIGCCAVAFALIYYAYDARRATLAVQARRDLDKAVTVLPPGTQEAWLEYVDRSMADAIQSKAGALLVTGLSDESKYLSRNTPYQVSCDPIMGGSIEFGYGENSTTVPIYGLLLDHKKIEKAPLLGVAESSIAAANLTKVLCERITASLTRLLLP